MPEPPTKKPNFNIARAALEAGKVAAEGYELEQITDVLVIVKMQTPDGQMNISSISTMEADKHLAAMIEATQQFAHQINIPLEMLYLNQGAGES